ncbi:hypothetical protein CEXT_146021 [Caerostris extrusa]|uniref:Uncharacterized protein n=1 Tax=Caerostris extrusa TaxID=172846 RepID=A0AAV4PDW3_CAEEX|nr:hypothetical protein CEXT_146021 [Caerostris extrusa]
MTPEEVTNIKAGNPDGHLQSSSNDVTQRQYLEIRIKEKELEIKQEKLTRELRGIERRLERYLELRIEDKELEIQQQKPTRELGVQVGA